MSNLTPEETFAYNCGIKQAQWQITKAMLALDLDLEYPTHQLLKFIRDEIEKELK